MKDPTRILLIEDNPADDRLTRELLSESDGEFLVQSADRVQVGIELLKSNCFDIILLDLHLPDSVGLGTLDRVREAAPSLPIVIKTSLYDQRTAVEAVKHGAQDYLIKGNVTHELMARTISSATERKRIEEELKAEISERKRAEMKLWNSLSRLDLLSHTASELLQKSDSRAAIESLCTKVMEHLDCQLFSNYLVDEPTKKLHLHAHAGFPEEAAARFEWLDFGDAVAGCVAEDGAPIIGGNVPAEAGERANPLRPYGIRAYACLLLLGPGNSVIGTLSFGANNRDSFNEEDISLIKALSGQIASAILRMNNEESLRTAVRENTRLYRQEQELRARLQSFTVQLSQLHNIGLSLNRETDKNKLLRSVLAGASELVSAGFGAVFLINHGRTTQVSQYNAPGETIPMSDEVIEELGRRAEALISASERGVVLTKDLGDLAIVPPGGKARLEPPELLLGGLHGRGGVVSGFFILGLKTGGRDFTKQDEEMAWLLASQASVALVSLENFEREHTVAATLQSALLPVIPAGEDIHLGIFYKSASEVSHLGGDFYDFFSLEGGKIAIMVGDVCGKGLEAATSTAMIKYTTRAYLQIDPDPGRCLTLTNQAVMDQISMDKFVTLSLAVLDPVSLRLDYASAGHPPPVIVRDRQAELLKVNISVPIGVVSGYNYSKISTSLSQSCSLLMYTDGVIEARPEGGEPFGTDRLLVAASSRICLQAQQLADALSKRVNDYAGEAIKDDICLLAVQPRHAVTPDD